MEHHLTRYHRLIREYRAWKAVEESLYFQGKDLSPASQDKMLDTYQEIWLLAKQMGIRAFTDDPTALDRLLDS